MEDCNFNGAMNEWVVLSGSWANEWELQRQAPNDLFMAQDLANMGVWPNPKSPWPSFKGNETVLVPNLNEKRAWNKATMVELSAGETVTYSLKFLLAPPGGSMRARDQVFTSIGEPILHAIPGYTLSTEMNSTFLEMPLLLQCLYHLAKRLFYLQLLEDLLRMGIQLSIYNLLLLAKLDLK